MTEQHFDRSKDRHVKMGDQVIEVIEDADGWITTPELAKKADQETNYSENYVRSKLYYMQEYLKSQGVETVKRPRSGKSGGDPAWHFRKTKPEEQAGE